MISQARVEGEREREPDAVSFGLRPGRRTQRAGWWAHIKNPVRQGSRARQRPDHKSLAGHGRNLHFTLKAAELY